ncbi:hypothetical protein M3936_18935 [Sutcliffiella horikoshii]|uniref:hypothetical protein n=1 Tax=Sutcliffiella horikoshii TaxID=79883 RepID=UPI00203F9292|nr:hypothetical protein [Sutcliffiella horikoshii]MCM3619650.1 hypothetical protein [Sutcliffiella horikoshii]
MKKLIIGLVALVIVLSGLLILEYAKDNRVSSVIAEGTKKQTYQFQDIESMDKAKNVEEAFDKIIGKERLIHNNNTYENNALFPFDLKPGYDTRMEMIDLLHYIQHSGLIENESGHIYLVQMAVYNPIKPGMKRQGPHQKWGISTGDIKVMDFSDKETMLREISLYGTFEGYNPSTD